MKGQNAKENALSSEGKNDQMNLFLVSTVDERK